MNKKIRYYVEDFVLTDNIPSLRIHDDIGSIYGVFSLFRCNLRKKDYAIWRTGETKVLDLIIEKIMNARKIFKFFKTYMFLKTRIAKFVLRVKERFYNPDSERNFMKLHAGKYVGTLGPKVKV